jgi:DNA-binding MarR family transcriptional regulator
MDGLDAPARSMVASLDRILDQTLARVPAEAADGEIPLTLHEVWLLKMLVARGSLTMSVLAGAMAISLPTATHLVDKLVAKGLVVRTRSEQDRRVVMITLSPQSQERERAYREVRVGLFMQVLESLAPEERAGAVEVFARIAELAGAASRTGSRETRS